MVRIEVKDGLFKRVEQTLSGAELEKLYGGGKSLAATPKSGSRKWRSTGKVLEKEMAKDSEEEMDSSGFILSRSRHAMKTQARLSWANGQEGNAAANKRNCLQISGRLADLMDM